MKEDIFVQEGVIIPMHEIEIQTSRAGGPGGQHVNKTNTRITLRWNIKNTNALSEEQKQRVLEKLESALTSDGDLIIHSSSSRSQQQNKKSAFDLLAQRLRIALHVPKKRKRMKVSKQAKEKRLQNKKQRGEIKKMRSKNYLE